MTKMTHFHSILPISRKKIAYEKKINLSETLGGISDQTAKKNNLNPPDPGAYGVRVTHGEGDGHITRFV